MGYEKGIISLRDFKKSKFSIFVRVVEKFPRLTFAEDKLLLSCKSTTFPFTEKVFCADKEVNPQRKNTIILNNSFIKMYLRR